MAETILDAAVRTLKPNKIRESGFVPGVLYGDSVAQTTPVQFEALALRKVLADHGANAKVWVNHDGSKKFGFIREVQRAVITGKVIHIDVQLISQDHEVKLLLPITFKGKETLDHKNLVLQVYKSEIEVLGRADLMPDLVVVDVSDKGLGETITASDFDLDGQLKIQDKEDEVYGIITALKTEIVEEEIVQ